MFYNFHCIYKLYIGALVG